MDKTDLTYMDRGQEGIVIEIKGGRGFAKRLESMGIRVGKKIKKVSDPFLKGPITIKVEGTQLSLGYGMAQKVIVDIEGISRILLMGNPNVGKSVVFSRLTGTQVISSNYPGTTVEYMRGIVKLGDQKAFVFDVPGAYTLEPTNKAEEVAVEMLKQGDIIVNVIDATNLERNLYLTLELMQVGLPMVVALNMWDETRHKGITIDVDKLEELLGIPVVPVVAVTSQGIKKLISRLKDAKVVDKEKFIKEKMWDNIGKIISSVQKLEHHHHTFLEVLEEISIRPITGLPIAIVVVVFSFLIVRFIGESLIRYVFNPIFEKLYSPILMKLSAILNPNTIIHEIIIGKLINGKIDFIQSFGLLTTGIYIELGAVLPYVISFYLILSLLEDFGYLPRLAVLVDNVLHQIGLHGYAIIPMFLGFGCNVPGLLATRILESRKEKFIAMTLMCIAVPCAALQAMIFGLVGKYGGKYVLIIYFTLFVVWLILGYILKRLVKGFSPELLIEIPPYRLPVWSAFFNKFRVRISIFLRESLPIVLGGVFVVNILYTIKAFDFLVSITAPVVTGLLGLPREAIIAIVIGFLRKDVAVGMLAPLNLTIKQLIISCTVLSMFFPCIATFVVLLKELGFKDMLKSVGIMIVTSIVVGTILNVIL